jgi:alpha-tubulin suppressor-like RCC1 family protein
VSRLRSVAAGSNRGWIAHLAVRAGLFCLFVAVVSTALAAATASASTTTIGWGNNFGTDEFQTMPLATPYRTKFDPSPITVGGGMSNAIQVVSAENTSYALLSNGEARAWGGGNLNGQLGNGERTVPEALPSTVLVKTAEGSAPLTNIAQIAGSYGADVHAMALIRKGAVEGEVPHEGEVATWGAAEYGERGNGESNFEGHPGALERRDLAIYVPGLTHVVAIMAAGTMNFALKDNGTVWGWGIDTGKKLGVLPDETPTNCFGEAGPKKELPCVRTPKQIAMPEGKEAIAIGASTTAGYAILSDHTLVAWGENDHGQLGNGTSVDSMTPVHVCAVGAAMPCSSSEYLTEVEKVVGGRLDALAIKKDKTLVGWGSNGTGELGGESEHEAICGKNFKFCQPIPKVVEGLSNVTQVAAGRGYTLAIASGKIYSLGEDGDGVLGLGFYPANEKCHATQGPREPTCVRTPAEVKEWAGAAHGFEHAIAIAAGNDEADSSHSLAIVEGDPAPKPSMTVTPENGKLVVKWRVPPPNFAAELKPRFTLRADPQKPGENDTPLQEIEEECSPEAECKRVISSRHGHEAEPLTNGEEYEVILEARRDYSEAEFQERKEAREEEEKKCEEKEESNCKKNGEGSTFDVTDSWKIIVKPSATPTVTAVSPAAGGAGTRVKVTGTNFVSGGAKVKFGSAEATAVEVNSANELHATAPTGAGTVDVTVTDELGTSAVNAPADQFAYVAPTVTGVSPSEGHAGSRVTVTGTQFLAGSKVKFGATEGTEVVVLSATAIEATAPAGSGTVDVTVADELGTSAVNAPADRFTYVPAPTVTKIKPSSGSAAGGTVVTITGTNFVSGATVKFGSVTAASPEVVSATSIKVVAPANIGGAAAVTVTTAGGTSSLSSADEFNYKAFITGVSPNSGPLAGGNTVKITGVGFDTAPGATIFKFASTKSKSVTCSSSTECTVEVPSRKNKETVEVKVTVDGVSGEATEAAAYTYT